jgi:transposase
MPAEARAKIALVTMDMHQPYIKATREFVPDADDKIVFDKFHVAKHLGEGVDLVRRAEHRALPAKGDSTLTGSKFLWLQRPEHIDPTLFESTFKLLRDMNLKTSRAWAMKEVAMGIWHYKSRAWAAKAWKKWFAWVARSRLAPMKAAAATIKNHLTGVLNAIVTRATNAVAESINSKIQKVKRLACGFRNRERFKNAIYFHCGGLDLYPASIPVTHTKA